MDKLISGSKGVNIYKVCLVELQIILINLKML